MKRILIALAIALSGSAFAADQAIPTTRVGVHEYATGLLRRPKTQGTKFFSFGADYIGALPESFDARTESNCIPPIRDQGQCGSCWTFARAGAFEAALCEAGKGDGSTLNLAEQDILVNDKSAYGCQGGFMDGDFEVQKGVSTEADCPYRASDRYACNKPKFAKATKWAMVGTGATPTVDDLRAAIYTYKAIAVTVAAGNSFNPIAGRIATCSSTQINHMVQLVGYRPAPAGGYEFLIKNSWGTSWGQAGFAWSKQGCNKLASDPGDAALFFYVEGDGPQPQPVTVDGLPYSVTAPKGKPVILHAAAVAGNAYKWTVGTMSHDGEMVTVQTTTPVQAVLEITDATQNKTTYSVEVDVK